MGGTAACVALLCVASTHGYARDLISEPAGQALSPRGVASAPTKPYNGSSRLGEEGVPPPDRGVALVLASCFDLQGSPHPSYDSLKRFAEGLVNESGNRLYDGHLVLDDRTCPGLCNITDGLNLTCHSAAANDAMMASSVVMMADCGDCMKAWTWQMMLPSIVRSGALRSYARVWIIESDVSYLGHWGALLSQYDRQDPSTDMLASGPLHFCPERTGDKEADLARWQQNGIKDGDVSACYGHPYEPSVVEAAHQEGTLDQLGAGSWKTLCFMTRMSSRLLEGAVERLDSDGVWGYLERWWPSFCKGAFGEGCTIKELAFAGSVALPEPGEYCGSRFFNCCPDDETIGELYSDYYLPLTAGGQPVDNFAGKPGLVHPIKWLSWGVDSPAS